MACDSPNATALAACCANLTHVFDTASTALEADGCWCSHQWTGAACDEHFVDFFGALWPTRYVFLLAVHLFVSLECVQSLHFFHRDKVGGLWKNRDNVQIVAFFVSAAFLLSRLVFLFGTWLAWERNLDQNTPRTILFQLGNALLMASYMAVILFWVRLVGKPVPPRESREAREKN